MTSGFDFYSRGCCYDLVGCVGERICGVFAFVFDLDGRDFGFPRDGVFCCETTLRITQSVFVSKAKMRFLPKAVELGVNDLHVQPRV